MCLLVLGVEHKEVSVSLYIYGECLQLRDRSLNMGGGGRRIFRGGPLIFSQASKGGPLSFS